MRDPERMTPTLEAVRAIWEKYPDLRLGQLIYALNDGADPFYVEDDVIEQAAYRKLPEGVI